MRTRRGLLLVLALAALASAGPAGQPAGAGSSAALAPAVVLAASARPAPATESAQDTASPPAPAGRPSPRPTEAASPTPSPTAAPTPAPSARPPMVLSGRDHLWIPDLHIDQPVRDWSCEGGVFPDIVVLWTCSGANNAYILGHSIGGLFEPLRAYYAVHRTLPKTIYYADHAGDVVRLGLSRIVVVVWGGAEQDALADASYPTLTVTLQTCLDASETRDIEAVYTSTFTPPAPTLAPTRPPTPSQGQPATPAPTTSPTPTPAWSPSAPQPSPAASPSPTQASG